MVRALEEHPHALGRTGQTSLPNPHLRFTHGVLHESSGHTEAYTCTKVQDAYPRHVLFSMCVCHPFPNQSDDVVRVRPRAPTI